MESPEKTENNLSVLENDEKDVNLQNDTKPDIHNNIEIQQDKIINGEETVLTKKETDEKSIQTEDINDDLYEFCASKDFLIQVRQQCYGCKPLHIAAYLGRLDIVQKLIEKGESVNVRNNKDETPLYLAVKMNKLDVVKYLVEKNAFIDAQEDDNCWTPLHYAVNYRYADIVEYLCSQKASIHIKDKDKTTPLSYASGKCAEIIRKYNNIK